MKRRSSSSKQARLCSVRSLIGNDVYNHDLDDLGDIKDIVIDVRTGRIGFAVIRCRQGPDRAEKLVALPWRKLTMNLRMHFVVLNFSADRLAASPAFLSDRGPSVASLPWQQAAERLHCATGSASGT